MAVNQELQVAGMPADQVFSHLIESKLSASEAQILIGRWIFENVRDTKRTFSYKSEILDPADDAACQPTFTQTFAHQDWRDGEDVVQAGETPGNDGFNARFHRIEDDLAALGADVAQAFLCMARMRDGLRAMLEELRVEINLVNADIFECCSRRQQGPLGPLVVDEGPLYLGHTQFYDRAMTVWKTKAGVMMLPAVRGPIVDPRKDPLERVKAFGVLVESNRKLRDAFTSGPVTKRELADKVGGLQATDEGPTVRDMVEILPVDEKFASPEAMLEALAERSGSAVRAGGEAQAAVAIAAGADVDVEEIGETRLDRVTTFDPVVSVALRDAGIATVADLAAREPAEILKVLKGAGVSVVPGTAGGMVGMAKALSNVHGRGGK